MRAKIYCFSAIFLIVYSPLGEARLARSAKRALRRSLAAYPARSALLSDAGG